MKKLYIVVLLGVVATTFVSCGSEAFMGGFKDGWNTTVEKNGGSSDLYLK